MDILFVCGMWGMVPTDHEGAFARMAEAGFDAASSRAPETLDGAKRIADIARARSLKMVGQFSTIGKTPAEHVASWRDFLPRLKAFSPLLINSQTGSDFFTHEENARIIREMDAIARDEGVRLAHETHRGRSTNTIPSTLRLLDEVPTMRVTADFSHWTVVHESLLEERAELIGRVIPRTINIHARVGHAEGPQVADPRAPEWQAAVDVHRGWWRAILAANQAAGEPIMTIHPEFGPPGYMPTLPFTNQPVVDLFTINCHMKDRLKAEFGGKKDSTQAGKAG